MGQYDSSCTRVVPVFDFLRNQNASGRKWLLPLLHLGSRSGGRLKEVTTEALISPHPRWWGCNERPLNPPIQLLHWLVANVERPTSDAAFRSGRTREKRKLLVERDTKTIMEARHLLDKNPSFHREWYVLEGQSFPDVCLVTDTLLVVIEGKRTERRVTERTTWMGSRSQMLRHMDAAREIRSGKRVLGLMIVEGEGGSESALQVPPRWERAVCETACSDIIEKSLPHRNDAERKEIIDGFLGATTWQNVCRKFIIPWPPTI